MHHISPEDLTLYSMQALTPAEMAEARAHLESCGSCRAALKEALGDVSLVGMSVPQQPLPEGARQRFMAAVEKTRQQTARSSRPAAVAGRQDEITEPRRSSGWGWLERLSWPVAAAAIAVAIYFAYHSSDLQRKLGDTRAQVAQVSAQNQQLDAQAQELHKMMQALTSPEAKQVTLTETRRPAQPSGQITYLAKNGALILVANNLHPLPQSKTYELWLIPANGKAPMPAGLFRPDAAGSAAVVMPPLPEGMKAKAFGVTIEVAQGSATPTLPIVMSGQ